MYVPHSVMQFLENITIVFSSCTVFLYSPIDVTTVSEKKNEEAKSQLLSLDVSAVDMTPAS